MEAELIRKALNLNLKGWHNNLTHEKKVEGITLYDRIARDRQDVTVKVCKTYYNKLREVHAEDSHPLERMRIADDTVVLDTECERCMLVY